MNRDEILTIVRSSIVEETNAEDPTLINETTTAAMVPGWDSLAHVRIMMNIEFELNLEVELDMSETYKASDIGELLNLFETVTATSSIQQAS